MKLCVYCGKSNADKCETCVVCKNDLADADPGQAPFTDELLPQLFEVPDISSIEMGYSFVEGFSRSDWQAIRKNVQSLFPKEDRHQVWHEISKQWLSQLKVDLGGSYRIRESRNFLFLSAESTRPVGTMLGYAEDALEVIQSQLNPAVRDESHGKLVILSFSEEDDYYSYISHFYPDGEHNTSAGVFIKNGCGHIAFPFRSVHAGRRVLTHELTHNCLGHLPIPLWLDEGLAQSVTDFVSHRPFRLDAEVAGAHQNFWNCRNIQEFWSGLSFQRTGESVKLSYSLAQILVQLLSGNGAALKEFIRHADYRDGGQQSAFDFLSGSPT